MATDGAAILRVFPRRTSYTPDDALQENETEFQSWVIDLAERCGWRVHHNPDSRKVKGRGLPDLVMWRPGSFAPEREARFILAELKGQEGRVSPEQQECLRCAARVGVEAYLWRPGDREIIAEVLR
jgi:hypothetical protein